MEDIRNIKTTSPVIGMNKDADPQTLKEGAYVNAINARLNTHTGGIPFISNEPSNYLCETTTYTVIGKIKLPSGKFAIFSTDNFNGEIGIFDEKTCKYERTVRSSCLNFNKAHLIRGVSKSNFDCSESVYFTDGFNPRRYLNFSHIPYTYTITDDACKTKEFTNQLDCTELLVDKNISYPKIDIKFGTDGRLENGSYQVALAYLVNGQIATDWLGVTFPEKIFNHAPKGHSLEIKLSNLDTEFDGFTLAVIYTVDGVTAVDRVSNYTIGETSVVVTNVGKTAINNTLITLDEVVNKRPVYGTADDIVSTSQYLMWTNPSAKDELNYQPDAMNIEVKWVAYKIPPDYYRKGGAIVGYMRDEVYAFAIQWLYKTGDWSPAYHIPGRKPTGKEIKPISGQDVYEASSDLCDKEELPRYFEVYNTAKRTKNYPLPSNFCDPTIIAEGRMAYWQSSENYYDNEIFGDSKCTPIRHNKFPDCAVIHHHDSDSAIVLGVKFENIKKPEGVVGYRIVRGDRTGNRSVIAKGLLFNTGKYVDNEVDWMYPNYPYNDLRTDPFLSTTQTKFNGNELNYNKLGNFDNTKFTFHSPSTTLNKPLIGSELKIEAEEIGEVKGKFEEVYRHPKYKLITNFSYGIAAVVALGEAYLAVRGRKCVTAGTQPGGADGAPRPFNYAVECETALTGKVGIPGAIIPIPNIAGIAIAFGYYFALGLQTVLNLIKLLASWEQFAYQYNSHGLYNSFTYARNGNRRRRINYGQYLIPGNQEINGVRMNNFNRESSVYLELNEGLDNPITKDNTRNTVSGFGLCDNHTGQAISTASSYYGSIKRKFSNQYGQLNAVRYLDTGVVNDVTGDILNSPDLFGGDTYVCRFTEKRKLTYFLDWPFDVPDGWEWDYRKYANIPYPRYWLDGTEFDFGEMARLRTPSSKHSLDCYRRGNNIFTVKDRYFYLFNSGVIDYYAESEYCADFRDWEDTIEGRHYDWHTYTNLKEMFRSDKIQFDNRFIFDKVYLKQLNENFIPKQSPTFDPKNKCFTKFNNRIIYSLAADKEQVRDNWLIYPGLNYFDFPTENGNLTTAKTFDRDRLIFLFDRSGPYITLGVNTLQTDQGLKVLLGDGGVFAQRPQELVDTDYAYGSSENNTWVSSHLGGFYPSQEQGRIFKFNGQSIEDITRSGMYYWFREHLPSKLLKDFPEFIHKDNTLIGIGINSVFDNTNEVYYLSKIDYKVKDEWKDVVTYDPIKDQWKAKDIKIDFKDPLIFENASFTVSYDTKSQVWISFHDWHPESIIQTEKNFITIKDLGFWKHNELVDDYVRFYDKQYPWEVKLSVNKGQQTSTLSSLEYNLECYEYKNRTDKFHNRFFNFNELVISNTEQISGLVKLELHNGSMIDPFPIFEANSVRASFSKKEQKYRVNQIFDLTKNRASGVPLFKTDATGYRDVINSVAVDYAKLAKKKFRHNFEYVVLRRTVSDNKNMIFKWLNAKQINSPR